LFVIPSRPFDSLRSLGAGLDGEEFPAGNGDRLIRDARGCSCMGNRDQRA